MENLVKIISHENDKVRQHTAARVNQKIDRSTEEAVQSFSGASRERILARIDELDREWDIDRVLMLNFGVISLPQLLAARQDRRWLWGPLLMTPFLIMHAVVGWCPPVLWFRRMGFRSRLEIENEKRSLFKLLETGTTQTA
ncbi:MAG TPA: hypothetical protein VFV50_13940 [Bdellovibrionales bacterium]|nr:hypothetical protein [Bdellovibrionales bacterium]